ncbi:MAG: hypothetical protein L6R36_001227 [Xanthoria steineri]|nr:MAG: hypothetical protein L6R36_001227 [Xanthoria steineri]
MPSDPDMAHLLGHFDTIFNNDAANTPVATSKARQNNPSHQSGFRDPELFELANSLQQGLLSQPSNETIQSAWEAFGQFMNAMEARSHHQGLGYRMAKHLDSFTTDPNDKATLAADQRMTQLSNSSLKMGGEIDQLRHERDQYRTKAASTDQLVACVYQQTQKLQQALREIERLNRLNQGLRASNASLVQRLQGNTPNILSNEEVIKQYNEKHSRLASVPATSGRAQTEDSLNLTYPWPPSTMSRQGQTTQDRGRMPNNHISGSFQQGVITPPISTGSSPSIKTATPHHQEPPLYKCLGGSSTHRETPTQAVPSNTFERMPRVSINSSSNIDMNKQGSSSPDASHIPPSSFGREDANRDRTSHPPESGYPSGPTQASSKYNHNAQVQPREGVSPRQDNQRPATKPRLQGTAAVQQPSGHKRGSEWLNEVAPTIGVPLPSKRVKTAETTDTAQKEPARKKAPVKKAAPKKIEPKPKGRRRSKKDKELEAKMWTPYMVDLQKQLLGQPKAPAPTPRPPKATETITIPDETDDDDDDELLHALQEAYTNLEEPEGATAPGNTSVNQDDAKLDTPTPKKIRE